MKTVILLILCLFVDQSCFSEERSFGHLLSRNDYIMDSHRCTFGLEFSGCRINSTLIGTSLFLYKGYDLKSLFIRQKLSENDHVVYTLDLALINNLHQSDFNNSGNQTGEKNQYDMSVIMLDFITTFKFPENRKLSFNNSIFYYSNYHKPFSLRRPDSKLKKIQLNMSLLFENPFTENISTSSELGILQYNGNYPRIHGGASIDFHGFGVVVKLGFSVTSTLEGFLVYADKTGRNDYQQELLTTKEGFYQDLDQSKIKNDFALHPEMNLQYFF